MFISRLKRQAKTYLKQYPKSDLLRHLHNHLLRTYQRPLKMCRLCPYPTTRPRRRCPALTWRPTTSPRQYLQGKTVNTKCDIQYQRNVRCERLTDSVRVSISLVKMYNSIKIIKRLSGVSLLLLQMLNVSWLLYFITIDQSCM